MEKINKLLHDRVLIKRKPTKTQSDGGIFLPQSAHKKYEIGRVIDVGPGKILPCGERAKMYVKPGDEVIISKHHGEDFLFNGVEFCIIRESAIECIID